MISWKYLIPLCGLVSIFFVILSDRLNYSKPFTSSFRRQYNKAFNESIADNITRASKVFPTSASQERSPLIHNFTDQSHEPLTCSECLKCNRNTRMPTIPSTQVTNTYTLRKSSTYFSGNWGNVLSPYWAARSMAELGGYKYEGGVFGRGTWMEFLPSSAPARVSRKTEFNNVCGNCTSYEFFHEGSCWSGWGSIAPAIQQDTRLALLKHSERAPKEENMAIFNFFQPDDWLIYNRCCVFGHPAHAPGVLRTYDSIPSDGAFHVFIMTGRKEDPFDLCAELIGESVEYIQKRNPKANVTILKTGTQYVDFARLVFAPNVLVAGVGSSWSLWSALLGNNNTVVSLPASFEMDDMAARASLPDSVQVLMIPALRNPNGNNESAQNYGIPPETFSNTSDDREAVLRYFRNA